MRRKQEATALNPEDLVTIEEAHKKLGKGYSRMALRKAETLVD